jgi:hypothetical protein
MRIQGSKDVKLVECINPVRNKWRVRWDVKEDESGASWPEHDFDHKPSIEEVKAVILGWYNAEIDRKILSGFKWNDLPVWLSSENQFNFKVAHDLTLQLQGSNLPMTMKLGEFSDGSPAYFDFISIEVFAGFYMSSIGYIQQTLAVGWAIKDSINWEDYEIE